MHDERKFIKHFEPRCRDMYIQDGFNDIQSSSRCRMCNEIKQVHKPEVYLTVNINNKACTSFTKFRLSSHKLLLERGCWTVSQLYHKLRKCTLCNSGDTEDEYHVTLFCEQFVDAGKKYLKIYFYDRPSMAKFVELMNTKSDCERYRLMIFVMLSVERI